MLDASAKDVSFRTGSNLGVAMACEPEVLRNIPLFALMDDDEMAVLASQVELKTFAPRERVYRMGDLAPQAYVRSQEKSESVL